MGVDAVGAASAGAGAAGSVALGAAGVAAWLECAAIWATGFAAPAVLLETEWLGLGLEEADLVLLAGAGALVALVSLDAGAASVAGAASSGAEAAGALMAGGVVVVGSVGAGWVCWAKLVVDVSARAAAIAGRALLRA